MRLGQASPARATTRLRALLKEPAPLILPGCFNAMSARILEHAGFPALYMSGYGTSLNLLGLPDAGLITLTEMALNAKLIASAVRVPVIASGGVGNLQHLVDGILEGRADAVLAASIFHFGEFRISEAKAFMREQGIEVRDD